MKNLHLRTAGTKFILCTILIMAFSACHKDQSYNKENNPGNSGNTALRVFLTDDPSLIFDQVLIDIQKVEIKAEDNDEIRHESEHQGESDDDDNHGSTSGGWITLDIHPGVYDILRFRNGLDTLFATGSFPKANELRKIRITLGNNNQVVIGNQHFPLAVKDNNNMVIIKLDDSFEGAGILPQLDFSLDFDAGLSIRLHGDKFELRSQIRAFRKEKAASIEGRVLPADAQAVVFAVNGTDTVTAKPEAEGEFKIVGLKAGTYSLTYHATANNYLDATVQNVVVPADEDAHVATVTLHK